MVFMRFGAYFACVSSEAFSLNVPSLSMARTTKELPPLRLPRNECDSTTGAGCSLRQLLVHGWQGEQGGEPTCSSTGSNFPRGRFGAKMTALECILPLHTIRLLRADNLVSYSPTYITLILEQHESVICVENAEPERPREVRIQGHQNPSSPSPPLLFFPPFDWARA